uniref:Putative salivary secreted peptide n=1 Tax=Ixodes ricinus TaxID=34613 RepID=A0A6B0V1N7_IXORI
MEIKWMLAYILLSILLVLGNAQKVKNLAEKALPALNKATTSKTIAAEKKAVRSTSKQAVSQKAAQKTTAAPEPQAPIPSTDPIICGKLHLSSTRMLGNDLKNNESEFALPSLQCTLRELPQNLKDNLTRYMTNGGKNETDLLEEICEAIKNNKNPEFMSNYKEDDKDMIHDTSTLCRIRRTTKSECEIPNLII